MTDDEQWLTEAEARCKDGTFIAAARTDLPQALALICIQQQVIARLHQLVCEARNYIDPDKHAEWEAGAGQESERCDKLIAKLRADLIEALSMNRSDLPWVCGLR